MDSELSEMFEVKEGMPQGLYCHPFFLQWWYMLSLNLPEGVR